MALVSLRLPDELDLRLSELAKITGRTKTYYLLEVIQGGIDELESIYLAEKRLEDHRAGRDKAVSLTEVAERFGLSN